MNAELSHNMLARVILESFKNWGKTDKTYKRTFKKLDDTGFEIVAKAFSEMDAYKPGRYNWWWSNEERRFKHVRNEQQRIVHELLHQFLTKYARGGLNEPATTDDGKSARKPKKSRRAAQA